MIEERAILALRERQRVVGRQRDAAIGGSAHEPDTRFAVRLGGKALVHGGVGRRVVDDAKFPLGIALRTHRRDRLGEKGHGDVVHRQQDRDQRPARQCVEAAGKVGIGTRLVTRPPRSVVGIVRVLRDMPVEHAADRAFAGKVDCPPRHPQELAGIAARVAQMALQHPQAGAQMSRPDHGRLLALACCGPRPSRRCALRTAAVERLHNRCSAQNKAGE